MKNGVDICIKLGSDIESRTQAFMNKNNTRSRDEILIQEAELK